METLHQTTTTTTTDKGKGKGKNKAKSAKGDTTPAKETAKTAKAHARTLAADEEKKLPEAKKPKAERHCTVCHNLLGDKNVSHAGCKEIKKQKKAEKEKTKATSGTKKEKK